MNNQSRYSNHLIGEASPYLLQHAHNPVSWFPWSDEAWAKAKKEDKLVLISIGYSSCHWCHVMEKESFENVATAEIMNRHFVCIKIDREERPDIDQVYMTAVQLMTGGGGWPLNCFALPDGRPVYGGTYFQNASWNDLLIKLSSFYKQNKNEAEKYAHELTMGVRQAELVNLNKQKAAFTVEEAHHTVDNWRKFFDTVEGGANRAPKFPLPTNFEFLLRYYHATKDETILKYVTLTLDKMAAGGIYDHLGGGFSRYSTDSFWKVPHFEKMLYDNAQLVSLYAQAYQLTKNENYRSVVFETFDFVLRELTSAEGGFYSALDADSEGEEGKYYVWKKEELANLLGNVANIFCAYYHVNDLGYWEDGNSILLRKKTDAEVAHEFSISEEALKKVIADSKKVLLKERNKRIRPGLDDKQLTSWNAMMIKACCDAYDVFSEKKFLDGATTCANLLLKSVRRNDGGLYRCYKNGKAFINGYLEDYSFFIEACIALYQSTFDEQWLNEAKQLTDYAIQHFYDKETGMFFFTSDLDPALIARKTDVRDNVIPSSNSSLAKGLHYLSVYFEDEKYEALASQMLNNIKNEMVSYGSSFSNWGILLLHYAVSFNEVVIVGKEVEQKRLEFKRHYLPNMIFAGSIDGKSNIGLLRNRFLDGKTMIYVCVNKTCKNPVEETAVALETIKNHAI